MVVVVVAGVVWWRNLALSVSEPEHAFIGLVDGLAAISAEAGGADAHTVGVQVAAVLALQVALATLDVAFVVEVSELDVGHTESSSVSKTIHVKWVYGGDGWQTVLGETLQ